MQHKPAQKNNVNIKHVSERAINNSQKPSKGHVIVDSKAEHVASKHSAILVVETKNERMRSIREYEKQRVVLRSAITW